MIFSFCLKTASTMLTPARLTLLMVMVMPRIEHKERKTFYWSRKSTWRNASGSALVETRWRTRDTISNPNRFQFFRANGYMPITNYMQLDRRTELTFGEIRCDQKAPFGKGFTTCVDDHYVRSGAGIGGSVVVLESDPRAVALRAKAIANANSRARDQQAGLGETFAELAKTRNMIVGTVLSLAGAALDIRRGRFASAARKLSLSGPPTGASRKNKFENNWLAYRYGWLPLYSTVYGSMVAVFNHYRRPQLIFVKGRSSDTYTTKRSDPAGASYGASASGMFGDTYVPGANWEVVQVRTHEMSYEVGYILRNDNNTLTTATSLGLTDPLSLAWELVPLSFVADWFLNVGDVLGQIGAFTGKTFLSGYETYRCHTTCKHHSKYMGSTHPSYTHTFKSAKFTRTDHYVIRRVLTSKPTFGLHLENGLNLTRMFDAIALLKQRLR